MGKTIMNDMITERLRDDIQTSASMTIEATGVALMTFTIGSIRNDAVRDAFERTARRRAAATERTNPDIILERVKRMDDQNPGSPIMEKRRITTATGDGRNSSSPIRREASSHMISQNAMAAARLALS